MIRLILFLTVAGAAVVAYLRFGDWVSLDYLTLKAGTLQESKANNPLLAVGVAFVIYVAVTALSLPGATVLTLVFGWYFGFAQGLLLVSFASTTGATLAFLLSRFLLRDSIEVRFGHKLKGFNEALARDGAFYLFTLRLIPVVPFFVINLVMGLTPVRTTTFWWVSQLGMLPGTTVFVFAGAQLPSLETLAEKGASGFLTPQLIIAFILLGLFPIVGKKILAKFNKYEDAA